MSAHVASDDKTKNVSKIVSEAAKEIAPKLAIERGMDLVVVNRNIKKPSNAAGRTRIFVSLLSLLMTRCWIWPCTNSKDSISTSRLWLYIGLWAWCILSLHSFIFSFIDPWSISAKSTIFIWITNKLQVLYNNTKPGRTGRHKATSSVLTNYRDLFN